MYIRIILSLLMCTPLLFTIMTAHHVFTATKTVKDLHGNYSKVPTYDRDERWLMVIGIVFITILTGLLVISFWIPPEQFRSFPFFL
jgi:hypothetical protein